MEQAHTPAAPPQVQITITTLDGEVLETTRATISNEEQPAGAEDAFNLSWLPAQRGLIDLIQSCLRIVATRAKDQT